MLKLHLFSVRQPDGYAQSGLEGNNLQITLELKWLDVGLVVYQMVPL